MKRLIISLAAIAALASCIYEEGQAPEELIDVTISAGIDTKTVMSGESVMWEAGDKVSLVFKKSPSGAFVGEFTADINGTSAKATFLGGVATDVTVDKGYADAGLAVYPSTAVDAHTGEVTFRLPSDQYAKADESGSFDQHLNLSSSVVSLEDIKDDQHADAQFRNALSVLRFNLSSDVESVVISAEKPLAGKPAAMRISDDKDSPGRLLVDGAVWDAPSERVTLYPENRGATFKNDVTYSVLIWPGKHSTLTVRVNFKDYSSYEKTLNQDIVFEPSKYYSLTLAGKDMVINHIDGRLDTVEGSLADIDDRLDDVEGTPSSVDDILKQIQSVSLMSEYLDNEVYARYAQLTYSKQKLDLTLDYIIRPESAVDGLVEAFNEDPSALSAVYGYTTEEGFELQNGQLAVKGLDVKDVKELPGIGKIVTASVDASSLDDKFYEGQFGASVALQIAAGKSSILSDFAHLVPKSGSAFSGSYLENITAVPGAEIVIPFSFATSSDEFTLVVTGQENVTSARVTYNAASRTGNLFVGISDSDPIDSQTVTLTLTAGDETVSNTFTFVDNGARINLSSDGDVDWIGGEVKVTAETTNLGSGGNFSTNGAGLSYVNGIFAFDENTGGERTATVTYEVSLGSLRFNKSISLTQKAHGTPLSREYYSDGQWVQFQSHNTAYTPINLVIMGDGFLKKDLTPGGRFERAARSAMNAFFSIEPAMTYRERFSVHMMTYASQHEGPRLETIDDAVHETAFETWYKGPDDTYVNMEDNEYGRQKVVSLVRSKFGEYDYYRTVVIMLVNSSADLGSTVYPTQTTISTSLVGDGYASFAIAMVGAYSSGMSSLVRHEGVGHGLGRLADEYLNNLVDAEDAKNTLATEHARGYYLNVSSASGISGSPWADLAGYGDTGYWQGAWKNASVIYRPSETSIMRDSQKMYFNAVSRRIIFRRIILQTEGAKYTDDQINTMFKEYDVKNL